MVFEFGTKLTMSSNFICCISAWLWKIDWWFESYLELWLGDCTDSSAWYLPEEDRIVRTGFAPESLETDSWMTEGSRKSTARDSDSETNKIILHSLNNRHIKTVLYIFFVLPDSFPRKSLFFKFSLMKKKHLEILVKLVFWIRILIIFYSFEQKKKKIDQNNK